MGALRNGVVVVSMSGLLRAKFNPLSVRKSNVSDGSNGEIAVCSVVVFIIVIVGCFAQP